MSGKTVIKKTDYKNATRMRWKNKRVTVWYDDPNENIRVELNAILPDSEMSFDGNFIRGNYKRTAFKLTEEAAYALLAALHETLNKKRKEATA